MWSNLICGKPERAARLQANRTRPMHCTASAAAPPTSPQRTCTGAAEITAPLVAVFHSFQQGKKTSDCDDLRARPTLNRKWSFFPEVKRVFGAYLAPRWGCGGCTDVPAVSCGLLVETQDNKICLDLLGKAWGGGVAANTHRRGAEGAVPAAGAARSSGPSVQGVCLHTPRAVCYGIVAVGLSESGSGEVWRRRSLASVPPN